MKKSKEINIWKDKRSDRGITLIALIITIIILVILAAVSINAVYNSGIVNYAVNGTQNYVQGAHAENTALANAESLMNSIMARLENLGNNTVPDVTQFQWVCIEEDWIRDSVISFNSSGYVVSGDAWGIPNWDVENPAQYSVDGNVLTIDFGDDCIVEWTWNGSCFVLGDGTEVGATTLEIDIYGPVMAQALEDRVGTEAIGIGTDGSIVDLSKWEYQCPNGDVITLVPTSSSASNSSSYQGGIVDGRIVGSVPAYVCPEGEDIFVPVRRYGEHFLLLRGLNLCPRFTETALPI